MNPACVHLFAGSGFPEQEDRRGGRRNLLDLFEHLPGRVAAADDVALADPKFLRR
jgi:hypothetical protein